MKRKLSEYQCANNIRESTRSKKPYLAIPKEYDEYVSGSSVINWFSNDCLVDWLKFKREICEEEYHEENYLCEQGNKFEEVVVTYIHNNVHPVQKVADPKDWSTKNVAQTFSLMQQAVPIIHSASIRNKHLKLYGTADLLVRNDYITKLFQELEMEEEEGNTVFSHPYFYYVVDVKWCTLHLLSDGKSLQNINRFPGYKGQLAIYNNCIAEMQGFKPKHSFLLGRKVKWTSKGKDFENNSPFKLPAIIRTDDTTFNSKVEEAIKWVRDLNKYGHIMRVNPPSRDELYPNLGSKYYTQKKKELAGVIGDLSQIYKVKNTKKIESFKKGIYNIFDYRLSGETLGFKNKDKSLIDKIIKINRQSEMKIDLSSLKENDVEDCNEIFVDFEKFTDIFDNFEDISNHQSFDMIFLIGVYYRDGYVWKYLPFIINEVSKEEEKRVITEFYEFYQSRNCPKAWYWFAEDKFWNGSLRRHSLNFEVKWEDLRKLFIDKNIVIRGCYDYKLKNVIEAMNKGGLIKTKNYSDCEDGVGAMLKAWEYYKNCNHNRTCKLYNNISIKEVLKYNQFDVCGMKDMILYFRKCYDFRF